MKLVLVSYGAPRRTREDRTQNLVTKVGDPGLVEEALSVLDPDNTLGIRSAEANVGHDSDNHMLLGVERSTRM